VRRASQALNQKTSHLQNAQEVGTLSDRSWLRHELAGQMAESACSLDGVVSAVRCANSVGFKSE
jgi:hypothetical protein